MKRLITIALATSLLAFAACGDSNPELDITVTDIAEDGTVDVNIDEDIPVVDDVGRDTAVPDEGQPEDLIPPEDTTPPEDLTPPEDVTPEDVTPEDVTPPEDIPAEDVAPDVAIDTFTPECETDDDCVVYGERAECEWWTCDVENGVCVHVEAEMGASCSDGNFCTGPDYCEAGACVTGPAIECNDNNACTIDECDAATGCMVTIDLSNTTILTCGTGVCYAEIAQCTDGVENVCLPGEGWAETCDGIDEDCDGATDNGNPEGGLPCDSGLLSQCQAGTTVCDGGALLCTPNIAPVPEKCDKIDNDCDGETDSDSESNGLPCAVVGKDGACGVGETGCTNGLVTCVQVVFPEPEQCDGIDNDCDNNIDEDSPGAGVACSTGLPGVCDAGITSCATGSLACGQTGFPGDEICDGLDNDCDGVTDPANTTGCTPFYKDVDGDGYGMSETLCLCAPMMPYTATNATDCCDADALANPGAATFRNAPNGCGTFDYNCDGSISQQFNYGDGSCGGLLVCKQDMVEGWIGAAPGCGQVGTYLENCTFVFGLPPVCEQTTKSLTQGCF